MYNITNDNTDKTRYIDIVLDIPPYMKVDECIGLFVTGWKNAYLIVTLQSVVK